jgi:hypothetical protein
MAQLDWDLGQGGSSDDGGGSSGSDSDGSGSDSGDLVISADDWGDYTQDSDPRQDPANWDGDSSTGDSDGADETETISWDDVDYGGADNGGSDTSEETDGSDYSQTGDPRQDPDNWDGDPDTGDSDGLDVGEESGNDGTQNEDGSIDWSDAWDEFDDLNVSANEGTGGATQDGSTPQFGSGGLDRSVSIEDMDLSASTLAGLLLVGYVVLGGGG